MSSDLSVVDLAALGYTARDFRPSDIAMRIIDEKMAIPYTAPSGADVLLPRWDQIRALFKPGQPATSVASAY